MSRATYDSDLTDEQWEIIEPFLDQRHPLGLGRPRIVNTREVVNAIFYLHKTGCQWRSLPHDFPPWPVVFYYFKKWRNKGTWAQLNQALTQQCRETAGRNPEPTAATIDSQSIKGTSESGGEESGFDGGKKVKGRKRHIVTDTIGYVLGATVHAANKADTTEAPGVLTPVFAVHSKIQILFADLAYQEPFRKWLKDTLNIKTEMAAQKEGLCRFVWNGQWCCGFEGVVMSRADAVRAQPNP